MIERRLKKLAVSWLLLACHRETPQITPVSDGGALPGDAAALAADAPPAIEATPPPSLYETHGRAGVVLGSCIEDDGINRYVARMWDPLAAPHVFLQFRRQAQCLATAGGGCAAVRTCLGWDLTVGGPPCGPACNGTTFTNCGMESGRPFRLTVDCGKLGLTCDARVWCSDTPTEACDGAAFTPTCTADGRGTVCKSGTRLRTARCADLQLACAAGQCAGSGAACSGDSSGSEGQVYLTGLGCDGARLRACVGGREQTFDCAQQGPGFSCQSAEGGFFCGLGSECRPDERARGTITCEGTNVVICNAGRRQRIDCTALGFTGCATTPQSGRGGCTPSVVPREIP